MQKPEEPCFDSSFQFKHGQLLLSSFYRVTGKNLVNDMSHNYSGARALYEADFCLVSHGIEVDPIFNYGNRAAQMLFELDWDSLTQLPSRCSAEPKVRAEREDLLTRVSKYGFIDDYTGVRISASGRRFFIDSAIVWNVMDDDARYCGQAAALFKWSELPLQAN